MHHRSLEGIEWRPTHHPGPQGELVPIVEEVMATAIFTDGVVAGSTGCSRYHATYLDDGTRLAGETLDMADADGRVVLRFRAVPILALAGSRWIATMINNGLGGVASLVEGTVVTAEFGADGRVAGSGGCNQFNGAYTLDGAALAIGPIAATRRACLAPEGVGEQEAAYLAALARVATWSFQDGRLRLRAADGALQVELRAAS